MGCWGGRLGKFIRGHAFYLNPSQLVSCAPAPFHVWFFLSNPPRQQGHYNILHSLTDVSGYDLRWPESLAWPSFTWPPLVPTRRVSKATATSRVASLTFRVMTGSESHVRPLKLSQPAASARSLTVAGFARIRSSRCHHRTASTPRAAFSMACKPPLSNGSWQGFRSPSSIAETSESTPGFVRTRSRTALSVWPCGEVARAGFSGGCSLNGDGPLHSWAVPRR